MERLFSAHCWSVRRTGYPRIIFMRSEKSARADCLGQARGAAHAPQDAPDLNRRILLKKTKTAGRSS